VREVAEPDLGDCDAAYAMSSLKIAGPVQSLNEKELSINNDTEQICSKLCELARTL
jgi:hypothetical protein